MPSKIKPQAKEPLPPPPDHSEFKSLRKPAFVEAVRAYREATVAIKALEEKKKAAGEMIQSLMMTLPQGVKSVAALQLRVTLAHGKTASKIDAKLLLENGVEPSVIQASTLQGREYTYPVITPLAEP